MIEINHLRFPRRRSPARRSSAIVRFHVRQNFKIVFQARHLGERAGVKSLEHDFVAGIRATSIGLAVPRDLSGGDACKLWSGSLNPSPCSAWY